MLEECNGVRHMRIMCHVELVEVEFPNGDRRIKSLEGFLQSLKE